MLRLILGFKELKVGAEEWSNAVKARVGRVYEEFCFCPYSPSDESVRKISL